MAKRTWLILLLGAAARAAVADEVVLRDGTRLTDCLARDEGTRVLVWCTLADFPGTFQAHSWSDVQELRIERGPEFDAHAELQDLSVTHIEVEPRLPGLHGIYDYDETGAVRLRPRLELPHLPGHVDPERAARAIVDLGDAALLRPEEATASLELAYRAGQRITLRAHVVNTGFVAARPFQYVFEIDRQEIGRGRAAQRLGVLERAAFEQDWAWQEGEHTVAFRVLPGAEEIASCNDERSEALWAWPFFFAVGRARLEYAHGRRNTLGSFSFEDYYQWHLDLMNELLRRSVYPSQPQGIRARVRLDRILYLDECGSGPETDQAIDRALVGADGLGRHQGGWVWRDSEEERAGAWPEPFGQFFGAVTEWSLPHELGHQLGLVDLYGFDYHGADAITGRESGPLRTAHFFRHPRVMMHWHGPHLFSESSAAYLNRTWNRPRGIYGEYLFETPERVLLLVLDANSRPLPNASVRLYQRGARVDRERAPVQEEGVLWRHVLEDGDFPSRLDPVPVIEGTTDAEGRMLLPNRPVRAVRTLNGYERRPNPFGNINVVGQRGLMLVEVVSGDRRDTFWLELIDLNLACARGHAGLYVETLKTGFPSADSPPPPHGARLETADGARFAVVWDGPRDQAVHQQPHRYQVCRRVASEGLNFEPWECLATLGADARRLEVGRLEDLADRPAWFTDYRRVAFAVSTLNERGVTSGLAELFAPRLDRVNGLYREPIALGGRYFLTIDDAASVVLYAAPGVFEDWTPSGLDGDHCGLRFDVNPEGARVSCRFDRHAVNVFAPGGMLAERCLGMPWEAGDAPGLFRHVADASIDRDGAVAAADLENRRVQVFDGEGAVRLCVTGPEPDQAFEHKPRRVRLRDGLLAVQDEGGVIHVIRLDVERARWTLLGRRQETEECDFELTRAGELIVLCRGSAIIRRCAADGRVLCETQALGDVLLDRPRGLVLEEDGALTTFNAFCELVSGRVE
ncbi:MAG: hypothetical protein HY812_19405 [Planctomycetes bacterium]|nr:hypothetical protein [Planctomycetota bacterium]